MAKLVFVCLAIKKYRRVDEIILSIIKIIAQPIVINSRFSEKLISKTKYNSIFSKIFSGTNIKDRNGTTRQIYIIYKINERIESAKIINS